MRKFSVAIAGIALGTSFGIATPARATSTVAITSPCDSLTDGDAQGCKFTGNIDTNTNGNSSYLLAQAGYNASFNPDITLTPLADLDINGGTMNGITITKTATGAYDLSVAVGINLSYFAVKAGNDFILYQYTGQTSFTTDGLQSGRSLNLPGLSHAVFFGTAGGVPEPATWAMMLVGFGMMGASARRRRARSVPQLA